jgi:tetratricopeptide (TPR) repeat protein
MKKNISRNSLLTILILVLVSSCGNKDTKTYVCAGTAKFDLKDYSGAIIDYTKAIEINPKDVQRFTTKEALQSFILKTTQVQLQTVLRLLSLIQKM